MIWVLTAAGLAGVAAAAVRATRLRRPVPLLIPVRVRPRRR